MFVDYLLYDNWNKIPADDILVRGNGTGVTSEAVLCENQLRFRVNEPLFWSIPR
jgi:hypothetical protein